jgi:hypothetical protein
LRLHQGARDQLGAPQIIGLTAREKGEQHERLIIGLGDRGQPATTVAGRKITLNKSRLIEPREIEGDVVEKDRAGSGALRTADGKREAADDR